jgi:hypothetical protein
MPQLIRGMQEMNCDAMRSAFKRGSIGRIPCPLFVALPLHQKLDIGFGHSQLKGSLIPLKDYCPESTRCRISAKKIRLEAVIIFNHE